MTERIAIARLCNKDFCWSQKSGLNGRPLLPQKSSARKIN